MLNSKLGQREVFDWPKEVRLEMVVGESGKQPDKVAEATKAGQGRSGRCSSKSDRDSYSGGSLEAQGAATKSRRKAT